MKWIKALALLVTALCSMCASWITLITLVAGDCPAAAVVASATAAGKDHSSSAAAIALRFAAGTASKPARPSI